jgi:hypothetical protein
MATPRPFQAVAPVMVVLALTMPALGLCSSSGGGPGRFPPPPPTPKQNLGANQPPVIWIGGTLMAVRPDHLDVREPAGSLVHLGRLAGTATSFFGIAGRAWSRLDGTAGVRRGQPVCVETLMDGAHLFALRVFLGAGCGPA